MNNPQQSPSDARNEELEKELALKNRELEIEAALERVRARAMAMYNSDELNDVLSVLIEQFDILGIHPVKAVLCLFDVEKNTFTFRTTGRAGQRIIGEQIFAIDSNDVFKEIFETWKKSEPHSVFCNYVSSKDLPQVWNLFPNTFANMPEEASVYPKDYPDGLYNIFGYCKFGFIGFDHTRAATDEEKNIVVRFANEFERLYQRFLDLQKAEAQAREAKIEAALERVRSRSMGMQKSEELREVIQLVFEQLLHLNIKADAAMFDLDFRESNDFNLWVAVSGNSYPRMQHIPYFDQAVFNTIRDAKANGLDFCVELYSLEEKNQFFEHFFQHVTFVPEERKNFIFSSPGMVRSTLLLKSIGLSMLNYAGIPYTDAENDIFKRLGNVFEQSYTRFQDLQKAEAQTREAQIEAALERVRSRTMGMQRNDELAEAASLLFKQVGELGTTTYGSGFNIWQPDEVSATAWMSMADGSMHVPFTINYTGDIFFKRIYAARQSGKDFFVMESGGEELAQTYRYMFVDPAVKKRFDDSLALGFALPTFQITHCVFFAQGYLMFISYEPCPEMWDIFKRFGKVFEQTYTRFLDLQKAEEQTREARIENALEKIRSRSLAMHKSDELQEVVNTVFERLHELEIETGSANIVLFTERSKEVEIWSATPDLAYSASIHLTPFNDTVISKDFFTALDNRTDLFARTYTLKEKNEYFEYLFEHTDFKHLNENRKHFILDAKSLTSSIACTKNACIFLMRYVEKTFSEKENEILKRFARVFEQAYIRFLDLQKAEAQAREARIENALERVRSRTMAMQKSDELTEVAGLLFEQVSALGIKTWTAGFNVWSEDNNSYVDYITSPNGGFIEPYTVHTDKAEALRDISNARKSGVEFNVQYVEGEKINQLYLALTGLGEKQFEKMLQDGVRFPSHQYEHFVFGSKVSLMFITYEPVPEAHDIFKRLGKVFEQTYTRFLDLQKAEAQARESQIQLALERVRARTMAMQKSDELTEAASLLFKQVGDLGIQTFSSGFNIWQESDTAFMAYMAMPTGGFGMPMRTLLTEDTFFKNIHSAKKRGEDFFVFESEGESLAETYRYMSTVPVVKDVIQNIKDAGFALPTFQVTHCGFFPQGHLMFITLEPDPEAWDIFKRFTKVFEQTYTRFLDLQKAEAQAREAKIEAALEKVRSRTMAMQKGEELKDIVVLLYKELIALGVTNFVTCGYVEINEKTSKQLTWVTNQGGDSLGLFHLPLTGDAVFDERYAAWKQQQIVFHQTVSGEKRSNHLEYAITTFNSKEAEEMVRNQFPDPTVFYCFNFSHGYLHLVTGSQLKKEEESLLARFTRVFEQTYARFLDLQKAEAQAREAQIELGLERVRARAMAMHKSDELQDTALLLFQQVRALSLPSFAAGFNIWDDDRKAATAWMAGEDRLQPPFKTSSSEDVFFHIHEAAQRGESLFVKEQGGNELEIHYKYMASIPGFKDVIEKMSQAGLSVPTFQIIHCAFFSQGYLMFITYEPVPEAYDIFKRFAKVFEQTYTRFLDLQKAEAQAREAMIEASLERVRAKTMAMHNSEDVTLATETMYIELQKLEINSLRCGIINIYHNKTFDVFGVTNLDDGNTMRGFGLFGMNEHPVWQRLFESWKNKEEVFIAYLAGQEKEEYFNNINNHPGYLPQRIVQMPDNFFQAYLFDQGAVWVYSLLEHTKPESEIMKRFASVFSLTFRRYQDLKKAEAQVREATIEAALEKVRGKAMAMHNSNDLSVTAVIIFTELRKLEINPIRFGVGILNKESRTGQLYSATSSPDGDSLALLGSATLEGHPALDRVYESWLQQEDCLLELSGEQLQSYNKLISVGLPITIPDTTEEKKQYGHFLPFSVGSLYTWSEIPYTDAEIKILKRFTTIVDLTFRRYIELQKSETNAREAIKQAALDRIRADIASMRTVSDLDRITPLIWNELAILGVSSIRCGVFIMDEAQQLIHTFLSTPDGKAIAAFHLPFTTPGNIAQAITHWRDKKNYIDRWEETDFAGIAGVLVKQGAIATPDDYLKTLPPSGFYLHFLPFLQGMLYVANTTRLRKEDIELIQSIADAFSTAYARYEDFNKLEAAKQQVDKTLIELKDTQKQLIQAEKMASLGELTAGIAHEIQNPLNFVNNFSEVNAELLEELKAERLKPKAERNEETENELINDVIDNEQKINHHGKRADAIVKGMLQHSQSSTGVKLPTNINTLTDEYIRLCYHGLRAKDKSFTATIKTGFDKTIEKINIVPQDIGRVVLNLMTNAFYAVHQKQKETVFKEGMPHYEPTVSVSTKKALTASGDAVVEISVADNGNGIPQKVLDKIFQPFFTTKPTGQGTGLGLSLSYDIIKAHGGEIKVETMEEGGTTFIIQLPVV